MINAWDLLGGYPWSTVGTLHIAAELEMQSSGPVSSSRVGTTIFPEEFFVIDARFNSVHPAMPSHGEVSDPLHCWSS